MGSRYIFFPSSFHRFPTKMSLISPGKCWLIQLRVMLSMHYG